MSRARRLLDLLQLLRRHRHPVAGSVLAEELGVSLRSVYRDIETLRSQGAHIEGEAGLGFVLRPGLMLPPLMFTPEEIEALLLGSKWVAQRADDKLADAAENALAKICAVLPADMAKTIDGSGLFVSSRQPIAAGTIDLSVIRQAMREERKLNIAYVDASGKATERLIWPVVLFFFDPICLLAAWCELRQGFRHFRVDRMRSLTMLDQKMTRRRRTLLKEWCAIEACREPAGF
jgi:predicted DNA-binding transcriptional regulator YafY